MGIRDYLDAYPELPGWHLGADGIKLERPSRYFTEARHFATENHRRGIIGYLVRNAFGQVKFMTVLQYKRMEALFHEGDLEVVDYVTDHYASQTAPLEGFDTEGVNAFSRMGM